MKMKWNGMVLMAIAVILPLVFAGCGKKADPNKPIDEIKKEVETMSVGDLEATAKAYANEISGKKAELDKVKDKLKELKPTELLGEKAKAIKDEVSSVGKELSALTQRFDIYAKKYKEAGGDLSKIQI